MNRRPLSFHPLSLEQVIKCLLKTPPEPRRDWLKAFDQAVETQDKRRRMASKRTASGKSHPSRK